MRLSRSVYFVGLLALFVLVWTFYGLLFGTPLPTGMAARMQGLMAR